MKPRRRIVALGLLLLMLAAAGCASAKTDVQTEFDIRADNEYMQVAIDEALDGIRRQHGGPFGGREAFSDYLVCIDREACLQLFDAYMHMDRTNY